MQRCAARGFTLIEVMITVAIVAILAAIALPSYAEYLRRGSLPDAFNSLSDYRIKLEQYYQDHRNYGEGGAGSACADGAPAPTWNTFAPASVRGFTFACQITAAAGQAYRLTATGATGRAVGHVYTLTSDNQQATTTFKGEAVAGKNCWLSRGDEC